MPGAIEFLHNKLVDMEAQVEYSHTLITGLRTENEVLRGEVDRYRALSKRLPIIALDTAVEPWWKLWKRGERK